MTCVPRPSADLVRAGVALAALSLSVPLLAPAARAQDQAAPQVGFLRAGLFCAPPESGRREAPDTISGWTHLPDQPIEIIVESRVTPAVLGQGFGVEFLLDDDVPVWISYEVTHPPMQPSGATRQGWAPDGPVMGGGALFFQFDEPEELVTGTWTFRVLTGPDEVLSIDFEVVPAGAVPHLTGLCRGTMLSSLGPSLGSGVRVGSGLGLSR